jgi:arsenate reductase-like glutaredoxin family protein
LVDARKTRLGPKEARALLGGADELVAAKGKKIERVDLRNGLPDKATVARLMIGPSGNLRAPTLRVGRKVLVGFDEDSYRKVLG